MGVEVFFLFSIVLTLGKVNMYVCINIYMHTIIHAYVGVAALGYIHICHIYIYIYFHSY
jgi:hypothetical protein